MKGSHHRRTVAQLGVSLAIAMLMIAGFALVGGVGVGMAHGHGNGNGTTVGHGNGNGNSNTHGNGNNSNTGGNGNNSSGHPSNHGATVSSVAHSTCSAANPNGVYNHGQCVSLVARGMTTESVTVTTSDTSTGPAPTHHTTKHGNKKHGKKHSKKH